MDGEIVYGGKWKGAVLPFLDGEDGKKDGFCADKVRVD
jgi:hypothetical protein